MKKKKALFIVGIAISVILGVISWFVLPDTVAVQVGLDGNVSNTIPKAAAILVPIAISVIGGIIGITSEETRSKKGALLLCAGIVIALITFFFNR